MKEFVNLKIKEIKEFFYLYTVDPPIRQEKRPPCGHCGKEDIQDGYEVYDGCIGKLPDENIMNACCGHGDSETPYVQFWSFGDKHGFPKWISQFFRRHISGKEAADFMLDILPKESKYASMNLSEPAGHK